jgi:hypothetical protein
MMLSLGANPQEFRRHSNELRRDTKNRANLAAMSRCSNSKSCETPKIRTVAQARNRRQSKLA